MLISRVSFYDFMDGFQKHKRAESFTYKASQELYKHLNKGSTPQDFDVIEICSTWSEVKLKNLRKEFDIPKDEDPLQWLSSKTFVIPIYQVGIPIDNSVVFVNF